MSKRSSKKNQKARKPAQVTTPDVEPDIAPEDLEGQAAEQHSVAAECPPVEGELEREGTVAESPAELEMADAAVAEQEVAAEAEGHVPPAVDQESPATEASADAITPATSDPQEPEPQTADQIPEAAAEQPVEGSMAQPTAPAETAPKRKARANKESGPKKLSALDAAAQVLNAAGQPMTCPEMIEAMSKQGLWSSPNGATPAATLYSAILRELKKGDASRFEKTERGKFKTKAS